MYTRIFVPLDGSAAAEGDLVHAVSMADLFGAELRLLRAAFLDQVTAPDLAEARRVLVRESKGYLNAVASPLR